MLWRAEMKYSFFYAVLAMFFINPLKAQTVVNDNMWITNGTVYTVTPSSDGSTLYIGGIFSAVGPYTGHGVVLDIDSGTIVPGFPKVNGIVYCVIPDGSGGWYIGGNFTTVGTISRNSIAHIKNDKTVDAAWNPNPDTYATIRTLTLSGSTLYVGGRFANIGSSARNNIAALDAATGQATQWNPDANDQVDAIAVSRTAVYIGGFFTQIGDSTVTMTGDSARTYLAALDSATGAVKAWNPRASGYVYSLAVSGSKLYAGGSFTTLDSSYTRNYLAALDTGTAIPTSWNPEPNGSVNTLLFSGSTLYIGGGFTSIGSDTLGFPITRNYLAALDTSALDTASEYLKPWNPNADNSVAALILSGSTIYAAGYFTNIGGAARNSLAAIDTLAGFVKNWNPRSNNYVFSLAVQGSTIYAGGSLSSTGDSVRNNIAALYLPTGKAAPWNPNADGPVYKISISGSTIYTGGYFTNIGNSARSFIAALDTSSGRATPWNPKATGAVQALLTYNSKVYAGGFFDSIGGSARNHLAELDTVTGTATSWNPAPNNYVYSFAASGSTLYVGGNFTKMLNDSSVRKYIAAFNLSTYQALPWDTSANGSVRALAVGNEILYAGGYFTHFGDTTSSVTRNFIAAVDASTGKATSWNPAADTYVYALAVSGSTVYAAGNFTAIGNAACNYLGALDVTTGNLTPWNPNPDSYVYAVTPSGSNVYVGGDFSSIEGNYHSSIAGLTASYTATGIAKSSGASLPTTFALNQNYPNPFNPSTIISFQIPAASHVTLKVYDILGRELTTLIDETQTAGSHSITFNAAKYASGVYFYRLAANAVSSGQTVSYTAVKKLLLLK
jgi:trimeric autotransporter adhesin